MSDFSSVGKMIMVLGGVILLIGLFVTFAGKIFPFGRLPGDILVRRGNFTFYFPVVTSIVISIVLTILFNFLGRK